MTFTVDEEEGVCHGWQVVSKEICPPSLTIEGGPEWKGSITHNSGSALLPPVPSGTDQHNKAKPFKEPLLRHEPHGCDGMCSCHTLDLNFVIPRPQNIPMFDWLAGNHNNRYVNIQLRPRGWPDSGCTEGVKTH